MINSFIKLTGAAAFVVATVGVAHAGPVLTNGNFTNGLSGWTSYLTGTNATIAENPSTPTQAQPQSASVVSFNTTGTGANNALFLNAGKIQFSAGPAEGGGVFQTFTTAGGTATFSADIAAQWNSASGGLGIGLLSVLVDDVVMASYNFGDVAGGPLTLRSTLNFTTNLSAGTHTLKLQAVRNFAPGRGVAAQYFDNVSFDVAAVPEPATWAMMIIGFGMTGASLRHRRSSAAVLTA